VLKEIHVDAKICSVLAGYFSDGSKGLEVLSARIKKNDGAVAGFEKMMVTCTEKIESRVREMYQDDDDDIFTEDKAIFDACYKKLKLYLDKLCEVLMTDLTSIDVRKSPVLFFVPFFFDRIFF
jgi:hypothetical protein